jgi:hypothetical protein
MPTRLCGRAGCPNVTEVRGYCREHASEQRKWTRSPNDAFYSSKAWKMSRGAQLFAHPLCEYQLDDGTASDAIADSVHHRIPIEDGGAKARPGQPRVRLPAAPLRHPRQAPIRGVGEGNPVYRSRRIVPWRLHVRNSGFLGRNRNRNPTSAADSTANPLRSLVLFGTQLNPRRSSNTGGQWSIRADPE